MTFPEGVIVSTAEKITQVFSAAYMAVLMVVFVLGPLIALHGYRVWWVDTFYACFAVAIIGGSIGRYRLVRQSRKADPATGH
jgi:H+/Cl- antiporter ClcA